MEILPAQLSGFVQKHLLQVLWNQSGGTTGTNQVGSLLTRSCFGESHKAIKLSSVELPTTGAIYGGESVCLNMQQQATNIKTYLNIF